jgi:hypothetical protein
MHNKRANTVLCMVSTFNSYRPRPSAQPAKRDHRTWMRDLADALIRRGDPRSLATAAPLMNANAAGLSER